MKNFKKIFCFILSGLLVSGVFAAETSVGTLFDLKKAIKNASDGDTIKFTADISNEDSPVEIDEKILTIDGGGHSLIGYSFNCTDSELTLKNITLDGNSSNGAAYDNYQAYAFLEINESTLTLDSGVTIKNAKNNAYPSDGTNGSHCVIFIHEGGTLNMNEGAVIEDIGSNCGALRIDSGCTFNMAGGIIQNCYTLDSNYNFEGVVMYVAESTVNITGGSIINNSVNPKKSKGCIFVNPCGSSTVKVTGGTITGNNASLGGAIYADLEDDCLDKPNTITVGGTAKIISNDGTSLGKYSNIYLQSNTIMTIASDNHFSDDALIGIYAGTEPTSTADVKIASGAIQSDISHLISDMGSTSGVIYCDGSTDYDRDGNVVTTAHHTHSSGTIWLSVATKDHTHTWTYATDGAKLTATCSDPNGDCDMTGSVSVTLNTPSNENGSGTLQSTGGSVTWTSSNTNVATVDEDGNVTAVGEGEATITATNDDGLTGTATVKVEQ